jgi:glutaconate CoA-transferase subunit A
MEFLRLEEAIARYVRDGHQLALEGFTHLIPFAAGREIIRQGLWKVSDREVRAP